jgi:hypothetical protein
LSPSRSWECVNRFGKITKIKIKIKRRFENGLDYITSGPFILKLLLASQT